nr:ribonuclease H-like domain, reverse transcriptase, RNA-dependent DNA polymerase [Tanacetum cinerariifolium]
MDQPNHAFAKIPILDTRKFEQWKFRIQQCLPNEHYALWEVIEFGDSYKAPPEETGKGRASESSTKKKGRTVVITTEDMQKRRNDVKARTTLLLALPDEHQLRFSKLQTIVSHLEFMYVDIKQDDLNQKFLTSLAPEWLMYTIVWRNRDDLDTMSMDDVYNHLRVYEPEVQKKSESNSQNMAFISSSNTSSGKANEEENHALVADDEVPTEFALMAKSSSGSEKEIEARLVEFKEQEIKFCEKIRGLERDVEVTNNKIEYFENELEQVKKEKEGLDNKLTSFEKALKDLDNLLGSQRLDKNKPTPSIDESKCNTSNNLSVSKHGESSGSIMSKPMIKFVKAANCPRVTKTNNTENSKKSTVKYVEMYRNTTKSPKGNIDDKGYWDSGCSRHMTGNISYLSEYEPYDGGYVSFGQGGRKITGKGIIKTGTQDIASQAVKKDMSSLRYIALPNWFHEAHMETKNSNGCNANDPESSGISNPTATSKIPSAKQVKPAVSLIVETEIPTVSSPVPTVCLDSSPGSSSDPRIISKGDFSQQETPSLGNALTFSNKFEDIFGEEADLSNMETSIPVSPTPTVRIHKDHPKSQIIGPVDTTVQTRHKSKEMEEQKPKKIFDALKDPSWVEAMQEELLQFKIQNVWILVDCPKGVRPIGIKWVLKNKKDDRGIVIRNKARIEAIRLFLAYASFMGFTVYQMDIKSAFLYGTIDEEKDDIFLSQDKYVGDILKNFRYSDVRSANTPMDKENPWGKDGPGKDVELHLYRSMMYLTASKRDIMFAVYAYARYQVTPKECHLYAVKRIFRYLKGHPKLGLWYLKDSPFHLVAYLDSDYGGATQDRKSTTRGCQFLGRRLISWQCKKQTIVEEVMRSSVRGNHIFYTTVLAFCDYHNMIAILEKTEHNINFDQIVDFLEASHISPKSTGFNEFSSNIATAVGEGSAIPTEPHHTPYPQEQHLPHHDPSSPSHPTTSTEPIPQTPTKTPTETPTLRQYSRRATRIAQSKDLSPAVDEHASLLRDDSQGEAFPTVSSLDAGQDMENVNKTSALPHDSSPRVTFLDANEGSMQQKLQELMELYTGLQRQQTQMAAKIKAQDLEISGLKARVKILEDKDRGSVEPSQEDAPIKGRSIETGEEVGVERSTELGSNDTKEMVNVISSMEAANILTSRVATVSVSPVAGVSTVGVPTVSGLFPTVSVIFTTASVVTPYLRWPREIFAKDKGKEKVVESEVPKKRKLQEQIDAQVAKEMEEEFARENKRESEQLARDSEIARLHAEEELKMMIEGLDRRNEVIAKHLQDYEQAKAKLTVGERIELINELMKTSEDVFEEDHKGMMQLVSLEEVYVEALQTKHPIIDWEIHFEGQREYWKIIRLGGHTTVYQFFIDMLKQFDREDLHQLWTLVKETSSIKQATKDKEKELWVELKRMFEPDFEDQLWTHNQAFIHDPLEWKLYDTCGVHHVFTKDQEIFMLVEKDYPLRKGLATVMICNKLQVEQYFQMANDLI